MRDYDAIVIGSGMGGLTAASLLTRRAGKRVLVLERHFKLGGFNHAFQRNRFHWDVGLHYVGGMGPGEQSRKVMDLVTGGQVDWAPMPDFFEVFHYPDLSVPVPSDPRAYAAALIDSFPHEAKSIRSYFTDVKRATSWLTREVVSWNLPAPLAASARLLGLRSRRLGLSTTADYLRARVGDPRLRAVLASQWGDYGLPPEQSAFAQHALIVDHYLRGAWYPVGGSDAMTDAMVAIVREGGGDARVYSTVEEILVEKDRAVGVRVATRRGRDSHVEDIRAPIIISDAGARATFEHLLRQPLPQAEALRSHPHGLANVTAYLGLRESPERLGFRGENHWYFDTFDHEAMATSDSVISGEPRYGYLSFPSLKDPSASRHTAEIITAAPVAAFEPWAGTRWRNRGEDYEMLKKGLGAGLIALVERQAPGFADLVEHVEVSTPLTVDNFAGYRSGSFADLAGTPDRFRHKMFPATVMPGLYLAGADAMALGIVGAMMGGVLAAGSALGPTGIPRLMAAAAKG